MVSVTHATAFPVSEAAPGTPHNTNNAAGLVRSDLSGSVRREAGPGMRPARLRSGATELNQCCMEFSEIRHFLFIAISLSTVQQGLSEQGVLRLYQRGRRGRRQRRHDDTTKRRTHGGRSDARKSQPADTPDNSTAEQYTAPATQRRSQAATQPGSDAPRPRHPEATTPRSHNTTTRRRSNADSTTRRRD
jgi:hypothetical protein